MKKTFKVLAIALVAVIGFSMAALSLTSCDNGGGGSGGDGGSGSGDPKKDFTGDIGITPYTNVNINTELTAVYNGTETVTLTYQWKKDGNNVGTNSDKYTPTEMGSYTVTISADGYNSLTSGNVDVRDPSLPDLSGTITINPNTGVTVGTKLTAIYSGTETVSYRWTKDGNNVGVNSNEYTPTAAGYYNVTVSAPGYNSKTSRYIVKVTISYILPEDRPVADRWWKWVDPESTATLDYSVAGDGKCTITVGGTAQDNYWDRWKASPRYSYTAKANTCYEYTLDAWTESGTRDLWIQYYEDNDESVYLDRELSITSAQTTYDKRKYFTKRWGRQSPVSMRGSIRNILYKDTRNKRVSDRQIDDYQFFRQSRACPKWLD